MLKPSALRCPIWTFNFCLVIAAINPQPSDFRTGICDFNAWTSTLSPQRIRQLAPQLTAVEKYFRYVVLVLLLVLVVARMYALCLDRTTVVWEVIQCNWLPTIGKVFPPVENTPLTDYPDIIR